MHSNIAILFLISTALCLGQSEKRPPFPNYQTGGK
jgi:hypothetical protein